MPMSMRLQSSRCPIPADLCSGFARGYPGADARGLTGRHADRFRRRAESADLRLRLFRPLFRSGRQGRHPLRPAGAARQFDRVVLMLFWRGFDTNGNTGVTRPELCTAQANFQPQGATGLQMFPVPHAAH